MTNWLWWNVGTKLWRRWAAQSTVNADEIKRVMKWMELDWRIKRI